MQSTTALASQTTDRVLEIASFPCLKLEIDEVLRLVVRCEKQDQDQQRIVNGPPDEDRLHLDAIPKTLPGVYGIVTKYQGRKDYTVDQFGGIKSHSPKLESQSADVVPGRDISEHVGENKRRVAKVVGSKWNPRNHHETKGDADVHPVKSGLPSGRLNAVPDPFAHRCNKRIDHHVKT